MPVDFIFSPNFKSVLEAGSDYLLGSCTVMDSLYILDLGTFCNAENQKILPDLFYFILLFHVFDNNNSNNNNSNNNNKFMMMVIIIVILMMMMMTCPLQSEMEDKLTL